MEHQDDEELSAPAPATDAAPVSRECVVCLETKELSRRTFTPSKGPGGFNEICKRCEGLYGYAKQAARQKGSEPPKPEDFYRTINAAYDPHRDTRADEIGRGETTGAVIADLRELYPNLNADLRPPYRDSDKGQRRFWAWVSDAVDAMYDERVSERDRGRITKALDRLIREEAEQNIERAFRIFFETLRPSVLDYVPLGPIHDDIIGALVADDRRRLILASRNSGKSTIVTAYIAFRLYLNSLLLVTVISKSANFASKLLATVRTYIKRNPLLAHLEPEEDAPDRANAFVVGPAHGKLGMGVSLFSVGLGGQSTGTRCHVLVLDDVEVENTHGTVEAVDGLENDVREFTNLLQPRGEVIAIGTPQTTFSLYGRMERSGNWKVTKARLFEISPLGNLISRWGERWSEEELEAKRRELGPLNWALHWDLSTAEDLGKRFPLHLRDLTVVDVDPKSARAPMNVQTGPEGPRLEIATAPAPAGDHWKGPVSISRELVPYTQTVAAVDPALGKIGGDAVGLNILSATPSGQVFIRGCYAIRAASPALVVDRAAELTAAFGTNTLVVETAGQQIMWAQQLEAALARRGHPLRARAFNGGSQRKSLRILNSLLPAFASGRLMVCRAVLESEAGHQLAREITQVSAERTHTRHDDIVDSLSVAVAELESVFIMDRPGAIAGIRSQLEAARTMGRRYGGEGHPLYDLMREKNDHELELEAHVEELKAEIAESRHGGHDVTRLVTILTERQRELAALRR